MKRLLFFLLFTPLSISTILGQNSTPKSVFFDSDKSVLRTEAQTILRNLADSARKMPQISLRLQGHTDADGSDSYNQNLSERRTDVVRQYLINQGIAADKIRIAALGESQPIAENSSVDGKQRNRRVDISFESATAAKTTASKASPFEKGKSYHIMRLYKELSLTPQTFTIASHKDTIIRGERGTLLHFPSNAFAGVAPNTPVEIKLKECYDYASMIAEHLTTKSGDDLLQTGGMIYVQALANGKELALQKPMEIQFSSVESKLKGMQLFSGERKMDRNGAMNWTPLNPTMDDGFNPIEEDQKSNAVYLNYIYFIDKDIIETSAPLSYILDLRDTDSLYEEFTVFGKVVNPKVRYRPRSSSFAGNAMGVYACETPDIIGKDKFTIHRLAFRDVYKFYKVETFEALQKQDSSLWNSQYRKKIFFMKEEKRLKDSLLRVFQWQTQMFAAKNQAQYQKDYKTQIALNDAFISTKLGWVNCDRFANYPENALVNVILENEQSASFDAKLILTKDKIVINNNGNLRQKINFGKVVKNAPAIIVAMKIENGQSYLAMHDFITSTTPIDLKFEPLSPEEIKEKLKKLN
jgi:hypothetical protein